MRRATEVLPAAERDSSRADFPWRRDLRVAGVNPAVVYQAAASQAKSMGAQSPELHEPLSLPALLLTAWV